MKRKCDDVCASLLDDARVVGDYRRLLFVIILASSRLEEDDLRVVGSLSATPPWADVGPPSWTARLI